VADKSRQTRLVLGHLLPIVLTTDPLSRLWELLHDDYVEEFDKGARVLALESFEVAP
jgi:hypothetical protein